MRERKKKQRAHTTTTKNKRYYTQKLHPNFICGHIVRRVYLCERVKRVCGFYMERTSFRFGCLAHFYANSIKNSRKRDDEKKKNNKTQMSIGLGLYYV